MNERGGSMIPAIIGVVVMSIVMVVFGAFLISVHNAQGANLQIDAQTTAQQAELTAVLRYDNNYAAQTALKNGAAQTFNVAGGGAVTVGASGGVATITTPTGNYQMPLVSSAGGN